MKKLILSAIVVILSTMLLLTGCGGDETTPVTTTATQTTTTTATTTTTQTTTTSTQTTATTTTPTKDADKYGGIYKYPLSVAPGTPLGYPVESAPDAMMIGRVACESLLNAGNGGVVYPRLAESWDIDPEAATMTFYLRQGVKFHDGSDLTAEVVKWNLDLFIEAGSVTNWKSIDVIDEHTIKLTLENYENVSLSGMGSYPIASKAAFDANGIEWARENPVGTGPFVFVEHERQARVYFEKNENYWEEGKPYLDGVEFIVISDATVRNLAFKRGDIHEFTASGLDAQELVGLNFPYISNTGGTFILVPDSANPDSPMSNLKVRQAISYAIDRESIAQNLGYGFARAAYQIYPGFEVAALPDLEKELYNPDKARQLLAEAGYPDGFQTTIHSFTRVVPNDYITAIAAMLGDVGITTQPDFPDAGKYTEYRFGGWNNALLGHALGNFANLNFCWNFYFGPTQFPSVIRPDEWVAAKDASLVSAEVEPALVQEVVRIMHEQKMVIPYLEETVTIFQRPGAHNDGLNYAPQTQFWSHMAYLEPEAR